MSREEKRTKYLLKKYGITTIDYGVLLAKQNYVCSICKEEKTKLGKIKNLCVDHIHVPGYAKMKSEEKKKYVRGLLCFLCNTAIKFEKSGMGRKQLEGMVEYFNEYRFKGECFDHI